MRKTEYTILKTNDTGSHLNFPIFLESSVDEMGVMVSFDGDMEQIEQLSNFSYSQTGSTINLYNSVNPDKLRKITEQTFTVDWGDGTTSGLTVNSGIVGSSLPSVSKTYTSNGQYEITLSSSTPWSNEKIKKIVTVPQDVTKPNPLGTITGITIPYTTLTGRSINYLNDLDYTNNTGHTTFTYLAIGGSRIGELRQYGSTTFTGVTTGVTDNITWSGYTIDGLYYRDRSDGYTMITGNTTGYTKEEVVNYVITRNEHFLGFIDDPQVYSDIFVERGKQGVMEKNLRLGEIDNMDELEIYGNGYFKIRKS